ncbi:MAG: hypothetical protein M0D55_14200 [Elusimicrobiota bacterium]|nr:MAG: hypothetical protein M0D55_14200 [Elusimicrobiota bacterium]
MLLRAGLLLAFLSVAQAQAPRSAVLAALAPSATDVVPIAELIRGFDPAARTRALETLDKLDRASLFGPDLAELSEAYRLLGRMDRVAETASLIAQRGGGPDGSAGAILALAQSGDYGAAQKAAEAALKKNPNDTNLLAAYHQVKNRSSGKPPAAPAAAKGVELRESSAANDPRPYVLRVSMPKSDSKTSGVESLSLSGETRRRKRPSGTASRLS